MEKPNPSVPSIKSYHELMANKVEDILLVSSPYDAFIMEEEGRLTNRIINEYRGLNLSKPPRIKWVSTPKEALDKLKNTQFDMIIAMPGPDGMADLQFFGETLKKTHPDLPFFMLLHNVCDQEEGVCYAPGGGIDRIYYWQGNADLLLAIIKNYEDEMNVAADTQAAGVRIIIMVEDSPHHYSAILPVLYKQIVFQTQSVIEESINAEHRFLKMRGRPKVLLAHNFEEAMALYETYHGNVLSVFSDMRFPREGAEDKQAGYKLLKQIKTRVPDLPVLILSTEDQAPDMVEEIQAVFINKTANNLNDQIRHYFINHLGFGDFIFRTPEGEEISRARNLLSIEKLIDEIPDDAIIAHACKNDFSRWLMARSEIEFALKLKAYSVEDFSDAATLKRFLVDSIRERRRATRQGRIIEFSRSGFDLETDFMKLGKGSLGGKARGLAFMASQIGKSKALQEQFPQVEITIPQTLIITTDHFKAFIEENKLARLLEKGRDLSDTQVIQAFMDADFPTSLEMDLRTYLTSVHYPIAVRSSSLFEDAHFQPFAGLYQTLMLPNASPSIETRLERLIMAIKRVYASTYLAAPRSYAQSTLQRTEDEAMAVVLQQVKGIKYKNFFYPAISGVVQSYNFYPIGHLKSEEGIAHIAMGLGKIVMEGGQNLRFCPSYPQFLPQFSILEDILENAQKFFYAIQTDKELPTDAFYDSSPEDAILTKLDLTDALGHPVVQSLCSTFYAQDNRIRDGFSTKGFPVLTFANILKYGTFPLAEILKEIIHMGRQWMGTSVEIEFALNLPVDDHGKPELSLLQLRPQGQYKQALGVHITPMDIKKAFCYSTQALGNGEYQNIQDLIYVNPDAFDAAKTKEIAGEINALNAQFNKTGKQYILMGPGRWGSSDPWLGIPVVWNDISNVGVMVETTIESIKADPSQGSHFFQNITSLGISYITVSEAGDDFIQYDVLDHLPCQTTPHLKQIHFERPLKVWVDGKTSQAVLILDTNSHAPPAMEDVPRV